MLTIDEKCENLIITTTTINFQSAKTQSEDQIFVKFHVKNHKRHKRTKKEWRGKLRHNEANS